MPVIGFLDPRSPDTMAVACVHFAAQKQRFCRRRKPWRSTYRWAENQFDRLPDLAAELVRQRVAVLTATGGGVAAFAAKAATTTIPIVFVTGEDPVRLLTLIS